MKKIIVFIMLSGLLFVTGCTNKENQNFNDESSSNSNVNIDTSNMNWMEKYIYELPSDNARKSFKSLWNAVEMTGNMLVRKMAGNTQRYEFDPSKEIPAAVSEKYDFYSLLNNRDFNNHAGYKITIDGEKVYIEFDGIQFYPSNYDITDIEDYVEKHCNDSVDSDYVE